MKKILIFIVTLTLFATLPFAAGATDTTTFEASETTAVAATEADTESTTVAVDTTEHVTDAITESAVVDNVVTENVTTEHITEPPSTNAPLDSEAISEVVEIVEGSDSKAEAILGVVKLLGVTPEEAENIINALISVGDEYLGQSDAWVGFKRDVQENMKFWIVVIACLSAVLTIVGVIFVLVARINPELTRSMFGTSEAVGICKKQSAETTAALTEVIVIIKGYLDELEKYKAVILEKEEQVQKIVEIIKDKELSVEKERRNMVLSAAYILQILKLICARSQMPLTDKAAIDLWSTRGEEALESELSDEDVKKIHEMVATLEESHG